MMPYALNKSYKLFQTLSYTAALITVGLCLFKCRNSNEEIYTKETDYIKWVTRVPAFTVCPAVSGRHISQQIAKFNKNAAINPRNVSFFANLVRPKKAFCPGCPVIWFDGLPTQNLSVLSDMFTPICESQLDKCSWNNITFPCCQYFQPLKTRRGLCYSMNSEQTSSYPIKQPMKLVTSLASPKAELQLSAFVPFTIYIHDRKATAFSRPRFHVAKNKRAIIYYKFTETIARKSAKELLPSQRTCVLDEEPPFLGYPKYHYTSCKTNCLIVKQLETCGCRLHTLPGNGTPCNIDGLQCLDLYAPNITKSKCKECKLSCTGQDIKVVYASLKEGDNSTAMAVISLIRPPTERDVYYAKTTILETLVGFVCLTRLITTADLYEVILGLLILLQNYIDALNFLKVRVVRIFKIKNE